MKSTLFVGITSWNSELFLPVCLKALQQSTAHLATKIVVLDNCSTDQSQQLVREAGVELIVKACNQADALNDLFALSEADYTLLIHADVVMLADDWFERCIEQANAKTVLISPEDIGCGPMSRPFGIDKPESSFMLFKTALAADIRQKFVYRHRFMPWQSRVEEKIDFYGPHVTHRLSEQIQARNLCWQPMRVLHSNYSPEIRFVPKLVTSIWCGQLAELEYGLGNFYSIGDTITHYHNWYDRVDWAALAIDPSATTEANNQGFPLAYIKVYTERFLADYGNNSVNLPSLNQAVLEPKAL